MLGFAKTLENKYPSSNGTTRSMRSIVGIHGRNDVTFKEFDIAAVNTIKPSWLKMMSTTYFTTFDRLRIENPNVRIITRLFHPSFNTGGHLSVQDFYGAMETTIDKLMPFSNMFEVHNEPNHLDRIEGWGKEDADAASFNKWFLDLARLLRARFPGIELGFPGLAVPDNHRDLEWLHICEQAVAEADFLCAHTYWQNFGPNQGMHLNDTFGLRVKKYHDIHPGKDIYITEAGNSNRQGGHALEEGTMAKEIIEWYQELYKLDYVKAACPFILSSPDKTWNDQGFTWIRMNGEFKPVVNEIARWLNG